MCSIGVKLAFSICLGMGDECSEVTDLMLSVRC